MVAVALVIAIAQVGGPRSALFTWPVYAAFVLVNLAITGLMLLLDRRRDALLEELARSNDDLLAEQRRSAALQDQLVAGAREAGLRAVHFPLLDTIGHLRRKLQKLGVPGV